MSVPKKLIFGETATIFFIIVKFCEIRHSGKTYCLILREYFRSFLFQMSRSRVIVLTAKKTFRDFSCKYFIFQYFFL